MLSDCLEGRQKDLLATVLHVVFSCWEVNVIVSQQKGQCWKMTSRMILCFYWGGWVGDGTNNQNWKPKEVGLGDEKHSEIIFGGTCISLVHSSREVYQAVQCLGPTSRIVVWAGPVVQVGCLGGHQCVSHRGNRASECSHPRAKTRHTESKGTACCLPVCADSSPSWTHPT